MACKSVYSLFLLYLIKIIKANESTNTTSLIILLPQATNTTEKSIQSNSFNDPMLLIRMFFPLMYDQEQYVKTMFTQNGKHWYSWVDRNNKTSLPDYVTCNDEELRVCEEKGWWIYGKLKELCHLTVVAVIFRPTPYGYKHSTPLINPFQFPSDIPICSKEIVSITENDKLCIIPYGIKENADGSCKLNEQVKVKTFAKKCGYRIKTNWTFIRVKRRTGTDKKPNDINSLFCEDADQCNVTSEYRIHRNHITFFLRESLRRSLYKAVIVRNSVDPSIEGTNVSYIDDKDNESDDKSTFNSTEGDRYYDQENLQNESQNTAEETTQESPESFDATKKEQCMKIINP